MKKGFTLIELLSVIVILAIILIIAIPRVLSFVDTSRINIYKNNQNLILRTSKLFVADNLEVLPINIGDTTEISIEDLVENKYLKPFKNPIDNTKDCTGYVLITKINLNEYNYSPKLRCLSTVYNTSEDYLLAYYPLDNNVFDHSINNYHGEVFGDVNCNNDGIKNQACSFGAFASHIDLPFGEEIDTSQSFSVSLWLKPNQTSGNPIFFAVDNASNRRLYLSIYGGKWDIGIQGSAWNTSLSNTIATTEWTNIVLTLENNVAKLFINGEYSMQKVFTSYNLASNFRLGLHKTYSATYQYRGLIDEVKIYNRALLEEEIKTNYIILQ